MDTDPCKGLSKLPPCGEEPCCHAEAQRFLLLSPESGDVKATIAVLSFILSSAAKHSVDSDSLSSELQQLGLPKGRGSAKGWVSWSGLQHTGEPWVW